MWVGFFQAAFGIVRQSESGLADDDFDAQRGHGNAEYAVYPMPCFLEALVDGGHGEQEGYEGEPGKLQHHHPCAVYGKLPSGHGGGEDDGEDGDEVHGGFGVEHVAQEAFNQRGAGGLGGGFGGADFGDFAFGFGADAFVAEVDKVCAADDFDGGEQPCGGCDKGGHAEHGIGDVDAQAECHAKAANQPDAPALPEGLLGDKDEVGAGGHGA